jgi:hypothetical protein
MKRLVNIALFFFLFSLCACKDRPCPRILATVDSLTYVKPDSAITLLKNLKKQMSNEPEATQMYYRLLKIKANDKAYITHTSDSLILPIVKYYEEKNSKDHLMEAYYYAGRVYSDLSDAPQALAYFQKAADASKGSTDYRVISRIYSQIGELSLLQDIYDNALTAYRKAYQYNVLAKDSAGLVFNLKDIAWNYTGLNKADSSLFYYKAAYKLAKKINNKRQMNIIQGELADLYTQLKRYDEARKALLDPLSGVDKANQSAIYATSSRFYYQTKAMDSASYYANCIIKEHGSIYARQTAHWILAQIAEKQGDSQTTIEQIKQYTACTDSIRKITNTESIRRMQSLYNYQLRERENDQLEKENAGQKLFIAYTLLAFIALIALTTMYVLYSKHRKDKLQAQLQKLEQIKEEQHKKSILFIEENKKRIAELETQLEKEKKGGNPQLQLLQLQKELYEQSITRAKTDQKAQEVAERLFHNSDIYARIRQKANTEESKMTEENWRELTSAINSTYDNFTSRLYTLRHFTPIEMKICLLLKSGFSITAIANLTMHSKSAITSARRSMYEKINGTKGKPEDWDAFISSF